MLFRQHPDHVVAFTQPAHAWLSGQLARAWGNVQFTRPAPFEEVCLGIGQHDIGWLEWEADPTLNPRTGLPHQFFELPVARHIALWTDGTIAAMTLGSYPALLVSLHAKTIYESYFDLAKANAEDAKRVFDFLGRQEEFRDYLIQRISRDPQRRVDVTDEALERNRLLLAALDRLSLDICGGITGTVSIPAVPLDDNSRTTLEVTAIGGNPDRLTVDPWPFGPTSLDVTIEGAVLHGPFTDVGLMQETMTGAERQMIRTRLQPVTR